MACGCIKNIYDAYIGSEGCKKLVYEDRSVWQQEEGYEIPESYVVTVTTPSGSKQDIELEVGCRNKITTVDLFSYEEESCLEDGIYCFATESCGNIVYSINRAFTCNLECRINRLIAALDDDTDFEQIMRYKALIESIHINAEQGNKSTAEKHIEYLKNELERFECEGCG